MGVYELDTKTCSLNYKGHKFEFEIKEITGKQSDMLTDKAKQITGQIGQRAQVTMSMQIYNEERLKASVISSKCDGKKFDFKKEYDNMPRKLHDDLLVEIDKINFLPEEEIKNLNGQLEERSPPQTTPSP